MSIKFERLKTKSFKIEVMLMSTSMPPAVGNMVQSAVTPTLQGMPTEIMDCILKFTLDSVRAWRAVSSVFRHIGEGALLEHAQSLTGVSSDFPLHGLIQKRSTLFNKRLRTNRGL